MTRPRIKICGITRLEDALRAEKLGADAIGFIFAQSPRRVSPTVAARISKQLHPFISRVGVFVNEDIDTLLTIAAKVGLSSIQLHGDENASYIAKVRKAGYRTLKAFQVRADTDFQAIESCKADGILLDAYSKDARGGTGETFNWKTIPRALRPKIILAGGIGPRNVAEAIGTVTPFGIDASSLLETAPGIKSASKLRAFFKAL